MSRKLDNIVVKIRQSEIKLNSWYNSIYSNLLLKLLLSMYKGSISLLIALQLFQMISG